MVHRNFQIRSPRNNQAHTSVPHLMKSNIVVEVPYWKFPACIRHPPRKTVWCRGWCSSRLRRLVVFDWSEYDTSKYRCNKKIVLFSGLEGRNLKITWRVTPYIKILMCSQNWRHECKESMTFRLQDWTPSRNVTIAKKRVYSSGIEKGRERFLPWREVHSDSGEEGNDKNV